ncbi:hypothetical protein L596_005069 [Steinernema carpocapsae]|uniref:Uncharacterized protein n=1 Tax=Steinernema carpocapsae TaxID=34508 RepID=A0A4V6I8I3_STECR|nr:hypothetical protein L596_005069 [Steinernema carpocapsae]
MLSYCTIFILCFSVCNALVCITCYGDSCAESKKWVKENCLPNVNTCYTLRNEHNKVYKRGCATERCDKMKRLCSECDSDSCNGQKEHPLGAYHGGGGLWDNAAQQAAGPVFGLLGFTAYALL